MKTTSVKAVFFSATGNTEKVVSMIAKRIAKKLDLDVETIDFTLPQNRKEKVSFQPTDIVVFGTPVYAGRVPNKVLPHVQDGFIGNGALAVPVVTFGNRNFDNGLIELRNELENKGFHTIAGAGIACSHSFSEKIGPGRPDQKDNELIEKFADDISSKIQDLTEIPEMIEVRGDDPVGPYYTPLGADGKPAKFLKAKPKTDPSLCNDCKICAGLCPMGSISAENPQEVSGICIKCQSCIKKCPQDAKYFDDEAFLSHVKMLEENYTGRAKPETFI